MGKPGEETRDLNSVWSEEDVVTRLKTTCHVVNILIIFLPLIHRKQWKAKKPLYPNKKDKCTVMKKKSKNLSL